MRLPIFLFPLLLFVTFEYATSTFISYNGTLHCNSGNCELGRKWCYSVMLFEKDWDMPGVQIYLPFFGNFIGEKTGCTDKSSESVFVGGEQFSDGIFDKNYEVSLYIVHNCTRLYFNDELRFHHVIEHQAPVTSTDEAVLAINKDFNIFTTGDPIQGKFDPLREED